MVMTYSQTYKLSKKGQNREGIQTNSLEKMATSENVAAKMMNAQKNFVQKLELTIISYEDIDDQKNQSGK